MHVLLVCPLDVLLPGRARQCVELVEPHNKTTINDDNNNTNTNTTTNNNNNNAINHEHVCQ